jgi:Ni,Fe-hydrogenase III large subunit
MSGIADTDHVEEFNEDTEAALKAAADTTAKQAQAAVQHLEALKSSMLNEQHKAKKLKTEWESEKQRMRDNCAKAADTITLNLRGRC